MRIVLFIASTLLFTSCFENTSNGKYNSLKNNNSEVVENFDAFASKFYADTSFQKKRIMLPLKGEKKFWKDNEDIIITEDWKKNEIPSVTGFEKIRESMDNANRDVVKEEARVIEKIYIPNSGFYMIRIFEVQNNKWFLVRYDISNV